MVALQAIAPTATAQAKEEDFMRRPYRSPEPRDKPERCIAWDGGPPPNSFGAPSSICYSRRMDVRRFLGCYFSGMVGCIAALAPWGAAAQDAFGDYFWSYRWSSGFDYSAGTFGDTRTTEIAYVPLTAQASRGPWTFKANGGWLSVAGPALILDGAGSGAAGQGVDRNVSGVADIGLSAMYSVEELYDRGVFLDLTARVKVPTASFRKGLGTGEGDLVLQGDLAVAVDDFMPFATLGYKFTGVPPSLMLRDAAFASLGLQYAWDERVATGVVFDYRQSTLRGAGNPQEGTLYLSHHFSDEWSFNLYGVVGFSRNSPSAGGGLMFTYRPRYGAVPVRAGN
jgi:hypothetical protein